MRKHISSGLRREGILFRTVAGLTMLALAISGCSEPVNTYQVAGTAISGGEKVLVMPFMDTRTFIDGNDPHKDNLGYHARDIFVAAMENSPVGRESIILAPDLPRQSLSLTNAQVAEYGRAHGADIVVAGQVFSYTETRAASIPPRAGMFVRVVSARDGAILFVGDHYRAAAIPGAAGGRDLQAKSVSDKLIEGIAVSRDFALENNARRITSHNALASIGRRMEMPAANDSSGGAQIDNLDPLPLPPPPIDLPDLGMIDADAWGLQPAPEPPPALDFGDDFFAQTNIAGGRGATETELARDAVTAEAPPPVEMDVPEPETDADLAIAEPAPSIVPMAPPVFDEPGVPESDRDATLAEDEEETAEGKADVPDYGEDKDDGLADASSEEYDWVRDASDAARMTGDELAADLFESETPLLDESLSSPAKFSPGRQAAAIPAQAATSTEPAMSAETAVAGVEVDNARAMVESTPLPAEPTMSEWRDWESAQSVASLVDAGELTTSRTDAPAQEVEEQELATAIPADPSDLDAGNGPVVSVPIAVEQPRSFRSADLNRATPADDDAIVSVASENAFGQYATEQNAVRVLILPYHERRNENNLIDNTGGGEVVTALYGSQLALDPTIQVMWDASGQTSHDRLVDREEALALGRMVNADYVVRGQVVEFRRAQSVPSFYSAVISTTLLAAQMFFAEMSGVDVATEVYRVSDGLCVMSRRDRSQQKYVVQAEKTVRRLAAGMADSVTATVKSQSPAEMEPLIDSLEPVTVLNNPWS